ncbi:hypothetical protein Q765_07670 [Flavobacterium rivuli WB 3.3-2 = DSM 21788]|uniref:Uncharacterized protein n=1 Tax=Flavobacterium rivuli WB 3.3-2 = DSM 21788 TaxID=1121895 RepID=A0A0A2M6L1_9FLAO|nr:hypothetical protein Q765_07670 [Flavobacterium rivuli WB 3.3-2 = DSM 21788]
MQTRYEVSIFVFIFWDKDFTTVNRIADKHPKIGAATNKAFPIYFLANLVGSKNPFAKLLKCPNYKRSLRFFNSYVFFSIVAS